MGRAAFAEFLAARIRQIEPKSLAYAMHVFGPWGAGKTSLLNLLNGALQETAGSEEEWLVVHFNAWRNQHIDPPWWSLMEAIFKVTREALTPWQRLQETCWRLFSGRLVYLLALVMLAWLLALGLLFVRPGEEENWVTVLAGWAKEVSTILALATTLWGGIMAMNRSLLLGSARAAKNYAEVTNDPTNTIKEHFEVYIGKLLLKQRRVAVLIDDMDRCRSGYVVELLESIQTMFREAPVIFVVAADRHWLNACYEQEYKEVALQIHEPGKPLGTLFLEKAFRFSTPMPGLTDRLKKSYWGYLLNLQSKDKDVEVDRKALRKEADKEVSQVGTDNSVTNLVDTSGGRSFPEQRALREAAAVRMAAPKVLERLEHTLKPYVHLLDPNPRAMKLLVNSYSANRALTILSELEIDQHQLALWTILRARWPRFAEYLCEHPELLETIKSQQIGEGAMPSGMEELCECQEVLEVIGGGAVGEPFSNETLKQCAGILA